MSEQIELPPLPECWSAGSYRPEFAVYTGDQMETYARAAIAAASQQAAQPKAAMTDEQIMRIAGDIKQRNAGVWPGDVAFARAIEAASCPNPALVEALQKIECNQCEVFDDDLGENVLVCMDTYGMVEIARSALASI